MLIALPLGAQRANPKDDGKIHLGISVLLDEQVSLIRNRKIVLVTDEFAKDERGRMVRELFAKDRRVSAARVRMGGEVLVPGGTLWASNAARFEADLDSVSALVNGMVVDLLDHGSRSGTAPRALLTALRVAARRSVPVFVLDRPNPITGEHLEGPVLDSAHAASDGVYGLPQRHGMTLGEMAKYFNAVGRIGATLTVVPVRGWRRSEWPSDKGIDVPPLYQGNRPKVEALVMASAFDLCVATSVRCTGGAPAGVAAPSLPTALGKALNDRMIPGVDFVEGNSPDYSHTSVSLIFHIENRDQATASRIVAAVFSELVRLKSSFTIDRARMAELTGSTAFADAILAGEDSDSIIDRQLPLLMDFRRRVKEHLLYR